MDERVCSEASLSWGNEGSSIQDLERGFFQDHSLSVSATSLELQEGYPAVHISHSGIVVEYTEMGSSTLASSSHPASLLSTSLAFHTQSPPTQLHTPNPGLTVLVNSKSSTPCETKHLKEPTMARLLELSCVDLTTSQPAWEVSLIRHAADSSLCKLNSSLLEDSTWSPKGQSAFSSLAELSSLIWSGTPPQANVSSGHPRPWKETVLLGSSQTPSLIVSEEHWQRHTSILSPSSENKDLSN
ncbi:uncharacterized protein si:ch73-303b9.1 [Megalops cyprinoides]|uniref:uncharacterized protein si:ch73-303b9.1 n=1 Tax=Megalops cyprinoides TaxID=118141 RepID=UPI001864EB24|nr:uncharacterized protein si:ch73-303b9.1 [Megalops cyprinoides]